MFHGFSFFARLFVFVFSITIIIIIFFFWGGGGVMSQDKIFSGVEETSPKKSWIFEYADSI